MPPNVCAFALLALLMNGGKDDMNNSTFGEWSVTTPKKLCSSAIILQSALGMVGTDPLFVEYIRSGHSKVWARYNSG